MNRNRKNVIRLTESKLREMIKEAVNDNFKENFGLQEEIYHKLSTLESNIRTCIVNDLGDGWHDAYRQEAVMRGIVNQLSHVDKNISIQAEDAFESLMEALKKIGRVTIALNQHGSTDKEWGHGFSKNDKGTGRVGLR